jgi:hypothetical protein
LLLFLDDGGMSIAATGKGTSYKADEEVALVGFERFGTQLCAAQRTANSSLPAA